MPAASLFRDPPLTPSIPGREQRDYARHLHHAQARRRAQERPPMLRRVLALIGLRKPAA